MSAYGGQGGYYDQGGGHYDPNSYPAIDPSSYGYGGSAPDAYGYSEAPQYGDNYGAYSQAYDYVAAAAASSAEDGSFFPSSELALGQSVTALGFDASYDALYVGSTAQAFSYKSRAATLATYSLSDNMLYSSVAGHPEAPTSTLYSVYTALYGFPHAKPAIRPAHIPSHAYRPPYGSASVANLNYQDHVGVTQILPLDGYLASISPSAVRIHALGGAQLHDYELTGGLSATIHPHDGVPTHISVGTLTTSTTSSSNHKKNEVLCMDLWQGLRVVSTRGFKDRMETTVGVTALATSQERGTIIAGCSDGFLRILDGSLREVATVKSHKGGVCNMSVSQDGMLIATAGFSSKPKNVDSTVLYAFPDPTIYIYDLRRLGGAGIAHPFAGVRGSPHHVSFLPDLHGQPANRLLVASGQAGGGLQIMTPFQPPDGKASSFLQPPLEQGESITAMTQSEEDLAMGTSSGRILLYKYAGYSTKAKPPSTIFGTKKNLKKTPLVMPSYIPPPPLVSLDAKLLLNDSDSGVRPGGDARMCALFSSLILQADPKLSIIGNTAEDAMSSFGPLGVQKIIPSGRRTISQSFLGDNKPPPGDFIITIPATDVDLLADHNPLSKRYKGTKVNQTKPNPNKFLYNPKLSSICYDDGGKRKFRGTRSCGSSSEIPDEIPQRYRLHARPNFRSSGAFEPCDYNETGLIPGWDYPSTMPNSFAPPVLLMLYFVPELVSAVFGASHNEKLFTSRSYEKALAPELGFVFHQLESLAYNGLLHPPKPGVDPSRARIGAWVPSNFLTALSTMPEAEQLQILDGSPAAVDTPRRPEAFYRFLAYQLDKELSKNSDTKLLDSLHGIDFVSSNQFITGSSPPSQSSTRAMALDLSYDILSKGEEQSTNFRFGDLLHHSLCRETRLRAWNSTTKAYETIVQRKIVTSLPEILTISCSCAGRKEEDGLWIWRTDDGEPWLPEMIEVELKDNGSVVVKQLKVDDDGQEIWAVFEGRSRLPASVATLVAAASKPQRRLYRLDVVLTFINEGSGHEDEITGHHVLHARLPLSYKTRILKAQQERAANILEEERDPKSMVLTAGVAPAIFEGRRNRARELLAEAAEEDSTRWILYNGFSVANTVAEDARAFHVPFKEPCLVVFRSADKEDEKTVDDSTTQTTVSVPPSVMNARLLNTASSKSYMPFNLDCLKAGKLFAFDAEFVSVQEEESTLLETGSKVTLRDTRHALGRISVIDCVTRQPIIDDHVLPREQVVDYLTRFSGIVAEDLDPTQTSHTLISARSAYLKLRYLTEMGCIFVGHGLRQDFATVNLVVPPNQILDTVEIYHQPGMRYISLRFLANFVLGRDMQQDIHDSVEDAMASFELYEKALEWKEQGVFDQKLQEIYSYGQHVDWKVRAEESQ